MMEVVVSVHCVFGHCCWTRCCEARLVGMEKWGTCQVRAARLYIPCLHLARLIPSPRAILKTGSRSWSPVQIIRGSELGPPPRVAGAQSELGSRHTQG